MSLVVLLRGINVGGRRRFRPKRLAAKLAAFDVVNIGAAGTFVVRRPGTGAEFGTALRSELPTETQCVFCDGRTLLRLEDSGEHRTLTRADVVPFVSFLATAPRERVSLPLFIPARGEWFVRVTAVSGRVVIGEYRRRMKTIGYLGQLDEVFGTVVTTRSRKTVEAIVRVLKSDHPSPSTSASSR